jgi:hypothetical protein
MPCSCPCWSITQVWYNILYIYYYCIFYIVYLLLYVYIYVSYTYYILYISTIYYISHIYIYIILNKYIYISSTINPMVSQVVYQLTYCSLAPSWRTWSSSSCRSRQFHIVATGWNEKPHVTMKLVALWHLQMISWRIQMILLQERVKVMDYLMNLQASYPHSVVVPLPCNMWPYQLSLLVYVSP